MGIYNNIKLWHPKLKDKDYKIIQYDVILDDFNCIAFALDIYTYWCGTGFPSWPYEKISRIPVLDNYIKYFKMFNYEMCDNAKFENGLNKIAIYINRRNRVIHVAKQFNDKWRSKLGGSVIIEHELEWLTGYDAYNYGEIGAFMKRKM